MPGDGMKSPATKIKGISFMTSSPAAGS